MLTATCTGYERKTITTKFGKERYLNKFYFNHFLSINDYKETEKDKPVLFFSDPKREYIDSRSKLYKFLKKYDVETCQEMVGKSGVELRLNRDKKQLEAVV